MFDRGLKNDGHLVAGWDFGLVAHSVRMFFASLLYFLRWCAFVFWLGCGVEFLGGCMALGGNSGGFGRRLRRSGCTSWFSMLFLVVKYS